MMDDGEEEKKDEVDEGNPMGLGFTSDDVKPSSF